MPDDKPEIPAHPELLYRITGEWKGWHDFLGPQSEDSKERDILENEAFEMLKRNPRYAGKYDEFTLRVWEELNEDKRGGDQ